MSGTPFRAPAALPELPKGAERVIIEKFRQLEASVNAVQVVQRNATPVRNVPQYMAKPGELVLLEGNAGGTLVTIPPGSPINVEQSIRVALVGGLLTPGVTIAIIGRKGTIDGAATFVMTSRMLVELTSVGERGWAVTCCGGGGGGGEDLAATLAIGNTTGGTALNISAGDELQMDGVPGVAGEVLTSQGPGLEPVWAAGGGGGASWAATLAIGNLSGANSPSIDAGQRLDFAGGSLAGGDVRGALGLSLTATAGNASLSGATAATVSGAGNGLSANAAFCAVLAGTSNVLVVPSAEVRLTAAGANPIRMLTNAVERLEIEGTGAWQVGGAVGSAGQQLTSQGAGTPPIWAAADASIGPQSYSGNPTGGALAPVGIAVAAESIPARTSGNLDQITSAVQTALIRAAGSLFFASCAADQALQRLGSADLGFSATCRLLRAPQYLTASNAAFAHPTGTRFIVAFLQAGGGGGGGAAAGAGAAGNGGNGGSWGFRTFTSISGTSNVTVGSAGSTASGVAGGTGGVTSVVHNAVTASVGGGVGGALFAAAGTLARNAANAANAANVGLDYGEAGQLGQRAFRKTAAAIVVEGGDGGGSPYGQGGKGNNFGAVSAGDAASGRGAGGGGAANPVATANAGGAATAGLVIFWEFS